MYINKFCRKFLKAYSTGFSARNSRCAEKPGNDCFAALPQPPLAVGFSVFFISVFSIFVDFSNCKDSTMNMFKDLKKYYIMHILYIDRLKEKSQ